MTCIELRFLANRYHGNAWGRHVNEGAAEWPPSPYRLFRAIYDAWKRKCSDLSDHQVSDVLGALAVQPPTFWLPKAVASHTRSYLSSNTADRADKSLIFDGFVALNPNASCFLQWDVSLSPDQRRTLAYLLSSLNYLGRSESWVEARLGHGRDEGFRFVPGLSYDSKKEVVQVACAVPPAEYRADVPWLDALTYSTSKISKDRLSGPPAMRYVPYSFDPDAMTTWLPSRAHSVDRKASAAIVELHAKVLPMITDSVRIAERIRGRLMSHFESDIPPMIHGKENGMPRRDHSHLFILPRANRLGRIDHVLIYTRKEAGFDAGVADAITNLRQIFWIEPIRAVAAWMGSALDNRVRPSTRVVKSSTPFVTTRHWRKGRGNELEFLKEEVRRECANHGLPETLKIESIQQIGSFAIPKFRRNRERDPSRKGTAFCLQFGTEVRTPFSLGYGCHFGLGQFE